MSSTVTRGNNAVIRPVVSTYQERVTDYLPSAYFVCAKLMFQYLFDFRNIR